MRLDEMTDDFVEDIDLLCVQPVLRRQEQIGDAPKRIDTLCFGAALDRGLQFGRSATP